MSTPDTASAVASADRTAAPVHRTAKQRDAAPAANGKAAPDGAAPKSLKIWIDGKLHDKADARISVYDHGLLYGDGVFEGIRVYSGRIFECDAHIERLYASAKA